MISSTALSVPVRTLADFQDYIQKTVTERRQVESQLAAAGRGKARWFLEGLCEVCAQPADFLLDWQYSDGQVPNFRERLLCTRCQLNNRQRFALAWIRRAAQSGPQPFRLYLYEQVTAFYQSVRQLLPGLELIGSEYLGIDHKSGDLVNGLRHEDAMALSFVAGSLDLIVSNDVLEHVPDYGLALQEASRVLKPQGKLVFSIPFYSNSSQSRTRAKLENGRIVELLPAAYHGNPISAQGSLVFHDFGWDILETCRAAEFRDAYALVYYSLEHGYVGNGGQLLFVAEK